MKHTKTPAICNHFQYCDCTINIHPKRCELCEFYRMIDSGYGYCIALPTAVTVAWCKVVCAFYKVR